MLRVCITIVEEEEEEEEMNDLLDDRCILCLEYALPL
jgi:hypothetical protein